MEEKLSIPMEENKTRQKIWRVVRFLTPLLFAFALALITYRIILTRDTLSAWWPNNAVAALRILKTKDTAELIDDKFHALTLFPGAPWTLTDLMSSSHREMIVFMDESGPVGIAIDAPFSQKTTDEAAQFGFSVAQHGSTSILSRETGANYTRRLPRLALKLLWPSFNGEVLLKQDGSIRTAPLSAKTDSLTIRGIHREANVSMLGIPADTTVLAAFDLSKEEAALVVPEDVPLVYPGVHTLFAEMGTHGVSGIFGEDAHGFVYALTVPESTMSTEAIENLVKESFLSTSLISESDETALSEFEELRSSKDIAVNTSVDNGITLTTARDPNDNVVRATETSHSLVLSNRDASIDASLAIKTNNCLKGAEEFVRPQDLKALLPSEVLPFSSSFVSLLESVNEIAVSKNAVRICW